MRKSLGEMLDNPGEYQAWMQHHTAAYTVIWTVDRLGLLGHLDDGPLSIAELAERCGRPSGEVGRLLAFLAAEGVLEIDKEGRVEATARTEALRANQEHRMSRLSIEAGTELANAMGTGVTAYEKRFGMPVFEHFRADPEIGAMFGAIMAETTAVAERFIFANHDFRPFSLAVDVGGNHGSLLLRLLADHPEAKGILFDLPETVEQAAATVAASGMADRVERVGGDFFQSVPAGGDLYLLKQILHDWSDEECFAILRRVRAAMAPGARLAVIERVVPEEFRPHVAYVLDILMLTFTTGRERRLSEYKAMFEATGFAFERVTENPDGLSVVEAIAA